jgi:hypothetical protein
LDEKGAQYRPASDHQRPIAEMSDGEGGVSAATRSIQFAQRPFDGEKRPFDGLRFRYFLFLCYRFLWLPRATPFVEANQQCGFFRPVSVGSPQASCFLMLVASCSLLAPFLELPLFIFSNLQPLFAKYRGWGYLYRESLPPPISRPRRNQSFGVCGRARPAASQR